jgi:hypothetical protein
MQPLTLVEVRHGVTESDPRAVITTPSSRSRLSSRHRKESRDWEMLQHSFSFRPKDRITLPIIRHGSGNPTRRSNGPGLCHRLQIWLASLLTWPTSPISPLPTSYVICDRSFVLHPPRSIVKRNGMLVHLPDVIRLLLQHGVIVRRSGIR